MYYFARGKYGSGRFIEEMQVSRLSGIMGGLGMVVRSDGSCVWEFGDILREIMLCGGNPVVVCVAAISF